MVKLLAIENNYYIFKKTWFAKIIKLKIFKKKITYEYNTKYTNEMI
jgi:hypothetical protein